jgi:hypothetical protein
MAESNDQSKMTWSNAIISAPFHFWSVSRTGGGGGGTTQYPPLPAAVPAPAPMRGNYLSIPYTAQCFNLTCNAMTGGFKLRTQKRYSLCEFNQFPVFPALCSGTDGNRVDAQ